MRRDEPPHNRVTVRSRALGQRLREVRERRKVSGRALGLRLGLRHSAVSQWETGNRTPSTEDVSAVLATLHVVGKERDDIMALAYKAHEAQWLLPGAPIQLLGVVECERAATGIAEWLPSVVPGLLQTAEYARTLLASFGWAEKELEQQVMWRVARREILERTNPVYYSVLIGEQALYEPVCSPEAMRRQMQHLLAASRRPNIDLRVMRKKQGWHPGLAGAFILYRFDDQEPVVYLEHYWTGVFDPSPEVVRAYDAAFDKVAALALSPEESRGFLERLE